MTLADLSARLKTILLSPLLPVWAVIALLPFGRSAEVAVAFAIIGVLALLLRQPKAMKTHPGARLLLWLWAAYEVAAIFSTPDAVDPGKSWGTVLVAPRFVLLGLYICFAMRRNGALQYVYKATALVVAVWLIDAWVQALTGWSLGGAPESERISGIFGADNLKLGPALAALSPFVLHAARARWGWRGLGAAFLALLGPILLAGSRASWLAYGLVCIACVWREARTPLRFVAWTGIAAILGVLGLLFAWRGSDAFHARMERTLHALQGSSQSVDFALAGRLSIWNTASAMIAAHPINGVGVRGFRYAYAQYATPGDPFVQADGSGAAHAHQWVLEVLTETGALGLALWLLALAMALRAWRRAPAAARERAWPAATALLATFFPLNTHLAFYSAWWGLLVWWLISLYCAALYADLDEVRDAR
ncbi:MAG: O-antigen ligase family protein [Tahibacter sp.]